MEKVRRAVAVEVESPPLELQTAARGVYHPWVGRLPRPLGGGSRGVGRPVGFVYPRLPGQGGRPTPRTRQDLCSVWPEVSTGHRGVAPKVSVQSLLYPPRGAGMGYLPACHEEVDAVHVITEGLKTAQCVSTCPDGNCALWRLICCRKCGAPRWLLKMVVIDWRLWVHRPRWGQATQG